MEVNKRINLLKAAKELNIGIGTAVELLNKKGFKVENKPTTKLTEEMYNALLKEFQGDKIIREEARQIVIGKIKRVDLATSNAIALRVIEGNLKTRARSLDLGFCGLTSLDFIRDGEIDRLLRKCTHVEEIILSNNFRRWDEGNLKWKAERSNNEGARNHLKEIPAAIESLVNLRQLVCSGYGTQWEIKEVSRVMRLKKLVYIDLSFNQITSVKALKNIQSLQGLNLQGNQLREVTSIEKWSNLILLELSDNQLENISQLLLITSLKYLFLKNNRLSDIDGIRNLKKLKVLLLNENEIEDIKSFTFLNEINLPFYIEVQNNPVASIYQLALAEGENHFEFIKEVLRRNLNVSNRIKISYPVKILLLGNHGVGKSSLLNFISGLKEEGSTHVMRIVNYSILKEETLKFLPNAVFFDFGGQDFYHGVYQVFISKGALQIIVFSEDSNLNKITIDSYKNPIVNHNLKYWLGQKTYQESNSKEKSPFLLVQSFSHFKVPNTIPIHIDGFDGYLKSFSVSLHKQSFSETADYEDFYQIERNYLKTYIDTLISENQIATDEPEWFLNFLSYIFDKDDKDENPTMLQDVLRYYNDDSLKGEDLKRSLVTNLINLHRFGLVLFYPDVQGLEDVVWLNPEKLVTYIQEKVLSKDFFSYSTPGVVPKAEFESIISNQKIVSLLKQQKVIFLHEPSLNISDAEYILPNFLPIATENNLELQLYTFGFSNPNFTLKFDDFIPFGFINQMICFFGLQPDVKKFWRNKLLFTLSKQVRVLIEIDFEALKVSVKYHQLEKLKYGDSFLNEYLFFSLLGLYWGLGKKELFEFKEFVDYEVPKKTSLDIESPKEWHWKMLKEDEKFLPNDLFISLDGENYINYADLFTIVKGENWIRSYRLTKDSSIDYANTKEVSLFNYQSFTSKMFFKMKKIFISYSKDDLTLVNKFIDHLAALRQDGKVVSWYCTNLLPGQNWDDEIKSHFDAADIACFMVSPNFMRTKYIQEYEVRRAIERKREDSTFKIIPIILDFCRWTTTDNNLGEFTALPYTAKPVLDFKNQNMAWYIIEECIRKMIDLDDNPTGDDHFLDMKESFSKDVRNIFERISRGEVDF